MNSDIFQHNIKESTSYIEGNFHKNKVTFFILTLLVLFFISVSVGVYFYYQNYVLKQTVSALEVNKKAIHSVSESTIDTAMDTTSISNEWSLISEDNNNYRVESSFVKIKAQRSGTPNNKRITTSAFIKDVGALYLTFEEIGYDEKNSETINEGTLWYRDLNNSEEKILSFSPNHLMSNNEFAVEVITHPGRKDVIIVDLGLQYYLVNLNHKSHEKIELTQNEYVFWEEIVGMYENNIVVAQKANNTQDPSYDTNAFTVRFWMAPFADLSNKTYFDK